MISKHILIYSEIMWSGPDRLFEKWKQLKKHKSEFVDLFCNDFQCHLCEKYWSRLFFLCFRVKAFNSVSILAKTLVGNNDTLSDSKFWRIIISTRHFLSSGREQHNLYSWVPHRSLNKSTYLFRLNCIYCNSG